MILVKWRIEAERYGASRLYLTFSTNESDAKNPIFELSGHIKSLPPLLMYKRFLLISFQIDQLMGQPYTVSLEVNCLDKRQPGDTSPFVIERYGYNVPKTTIPFQE